jgi:hypothetical protein
VYRSKGGDLYDIGQVEIAQRDCAGQKRLRDWKAASALQAVSSLRSDSLRDQLLEEMISLSLGADAPDSGEFQRFPEAVGAVLTVPIAATNLLMVATPSDHCLLNTLAECQTSFQSLAAREVDDDHRR